MGRGKRYNKEKKLNMKKVFGCIIVLAAFVLFVIAINKILNLEENKTIAKIEPTYHLIYDNNKWGVMDNDAKIIIAPTYDEIIQIPDSKVGLFICTYDVNYENGTYKTKIINEKNEEILKEYDSISAINNFNEKEHWYEDNVLKFKKDDKFGLLDLSGKVVLEAKYNNVTPLQGSKNVMIITQDLLIGLVNNGGKILVEPAEYQEIKNVNIENAFIVKKDNKYGIINTEQGMILEQEYSDIKEFSTKDILVAKKDGKWQLYNKEKQEIVLANGYDDFYGINQELVIAKKNGKLGITSIVEDVNISEIKYDDVKYAFSNNYIVKLNNKYGIINSKGEIKLEINYKNIIYRDEINCFECEVENQIDAEIYNKNLENVVTGVITQVNVEKAYVKIRKDSEYKYYNLDFAQKTNIEALIGNEIFLVKKEDKYGYINKNNETIVEPIYDDATEQNEYGYAAVKKDGLWGAIDSKGKVVVETKYNLDNNNTINFIGEWYEIINEKFVYFVK